MARIEDMNEEIIERLCNGDARPTVSENTMSAIYRICGARTERLFRRDSAGSAAMAHAEQRAQIIVKPAYAVASVWTMTAPEFAEHLANAAPGVDYVDQIDDGPRGFTVPVGTDDDDPSDAQIDAYRERMGQYRA